MRNRFALTTVAALAAAAAFAQAPRGEASLTLGGKTVTIEYGRPSLQGRDMLGRATVGSDWRMGADAATTLNSEADLAFGDAAVPKGNYTLSATKLSEDAWQLNVQDSAGTRVAEIPLEAATLAESVETFSIALTEKDGAGVFQMSWGTAALSAAFSAK